MGEEEPAGPIAEGKIIITDLLGVGKAAEKLTPAATKIIDAISGGVAKLYEPASIYFNSRSENAANRHNALADAEAYRELTTRSPHVLESMRMRILGTEYHRQENILAAEAEAVALAQANPSGDAKDIQSDFVAEWIEGVKDVSDETVRHLWARLLAEAPSTGAGRVSKPVVDFLKLLDRELCQSLAFFYRTSFATNGNMFDELGGIDPLIEEVGIGSYGQRAYLDTIDRTLRMQAREGSFHLFSMGERATRLCEIAFPVVDEEKSLRDFYKSLPQVLTAIRSAGSLKHMTIEVRDAREHRHLFDMQIVNGEVVKPRRGGDVAGVMRHMNLTGKACAEDLRNGLSELGEWLQYRGSEKVHEVPL